MKYFSSALGIGLFALISVNSFADTALPSSKNCMGCHAVERKVLGPAFREIAGKYSSQPDAISKISEKIRKGSVGAWGPIPMPPNQMVSEADAKLLAQWILLQK